MTLQNKVQQFTQDADKLNAIVHGPAAGAASTVATDGGTVRTVAKLIADQDAAINAAANGVLAGATAARDTATTQAGLASAAKVAAEAARDSANSSARAYTSAQGTAAALADAAVVVGQTFAVVAADLLSYTVYRKDAGPVATQMFVQYTKGSLDAAIARTTGLETSAFTITGYRGAANGGLSVDASWRTTDLIPVDGLTVNSFKLYGHTNVSTICFYSATGAYVSGVVAPSIGAYVTAYPAVPAGAAYVAFTLYVGDLANEAFNVSITAQLPATLRKRLEYVELQDQFTRPGYISTTGLLTPDANWASTQLLALSQITVKAMALVGHTAVSTVAFYDANQVFISGVSATANNTMVRTYPAVPANAAYVSFTCTRQEQYGTQEFKAIVSPQAAVIGNTDLAKQATAAGFVTTTGADSSTADTNWLRSDYLPLNPGVVIVCNMVGHTAVNCVSFYDSKRALLAGYKATSTVLPGARFQQTVTSPANTAYVRVSFASPTSVLGTGQTNTGLATIDLYSGIVANSAKASANAVAIPLIRPYQSRRRLKLQPTDKVILYGDSISSTDYPWYQSAMVALTGATVYNGGFSGFTSAQLAANAQLQRIWDYGARLVVAMVGGNDSGASGSVGTFDGTVFGEPVVTETDIAVDYAGTTYIQAVSHLIRKFQAQYSNIRARAGLTGAEDEAAKTAKIDAVLKPVLVLASPLPQKRTDASNAFSQAANWKRKRDAVVECCAKYKVHCVDLTNLIPWDMNAEPYYVGPTDKVTNNGVYMMDGVHPNKYGYQIISEIVCADLGL